jgi:hypothetical protein
MTFNNVRTEPEGSSTLLRRSCHMKYQRISDRTLKKSNANNPGPQFALLSSFRRVLRQLPSQLPPNARLLDRVFSRHQRPRLCLDERGRRRRRRPRRDRRGHHQLARRIAQGRLGHRRIRRPGQQGSNSTKVRCGAEIRTLK